MKIDYSKSCGPLMKRPVLSAFEEFIGIEYYTALDVSDEAAAAEWASFRENPSRFYIHASAEHRNALWAVIEKRLTIGESND